MLECKRNLQTKKWNPNTKIKKAYCANSLPDCHSKTIHIAIVFGILTCTSDNKII